MGQTIKNLKIEEGDMVRITDNEDNIFVGYVYTPNPILRLFGIKVLLFRGQQPISAKWFLWGTKDVHIIKPLKFRENQIKKISIEKY